ncbi:hypothetical protein RAS12_26860 [Achromobacter seleniivolatilans]|uniref:Chromosome partition protein Smc n=1 Tax=Achromobacter seleniivolatilans TaxID=3047478 RepID=A0ABY9M1W5_9BURK|nr:hypothetical protein [Achromobacter sp. R39]WMD20188.1 hypothetical protein RAS12_26860 [Achromobacter sp. R39]
MASNVIWYAGPCIKRAEKGTASHLEAVAQLVNSEWRLIDDPKILFRGMNDVELRAADARQLRVSDWAAFTIGIKGSRTKSWPATAHRRLHRYVDLSALEGAEQAQRQLVVEGVQTRQPSGTWIVRCAEDEVLQVELRQHEGVAHLALGNGRVSAYRFDPESVTRMPTPDGEVDLYDLKGATPARYYDWTPDDSFALRVVRAAVDAGDGHARSLVAWLESHAKQGEGLLPVKSADISAANEALRSGKLAKRLAEDQELLRSFLDVLVDDERIGALIKEGAERVVEQERADARVRAEAEAKREMEASRKHRLAALKEELENAAQIGRKSLSEELDKLRAHGEAELQQSVSARVGAMEKRAGELDAHCKALAIEAGHAKAAVGEERQKAASIRCEIAEAQASLNAIQVSTAMAAAELAVEQTRLTAAQTKCPVIVRPGATKLLTLEGVGAEIDASRLLSGRGKTLMANFLALTLAGEVPALCGPGVDDFLLAAEIMFGGGRSVRMEADPTILTFEDLWIRAGTDLHTGFGQALAMASGIEGKPRTMLAVLERAERSGGRFWYPTLADRAQRGTLPRSLLICVTIADQECEEALEILSRAVRLDLNDVLEADSSLPLAMIAASAGTATELDTGRERANVALGAAAVATDAPQLGAWRSLRAMRAVAEATSLSPVARLSELVHLFLGTGGKPASANKPQRATHA